MKFVSKIIKGLGKGKQLGFPTINMEVPVDFALEDGVYASFVLLNGEKYQGALFFGKRYLFDKLTNSLEVYLLNFDGEVNTDIIEVEIVQKIRESQKYKDENDLKKAIADDVQKCKQILDVQSA